MSTRCLIAFVYILFSGMENVWADIRSPVAQWAGITEHRLDNGLRVVLAQDDSSRAVNFNLVYRTGSLADPDGHSGTAHLLEHLMFKGTTKRSAEHLLDGLHQRGIQFYATTSFDRTRYTAVFDADASRLDYLLALEAERMADLRFDQATLNSEVEVVLRELERAQDDPFGALSQRMFATATPGKGFGRQVLGTREDLRAIGIEDLQRFYQVNYRPDNAVIVITGKFDPAQVLAAVSHHFATLKPLTGGAVAEHLEAALPVSNPATAQVKLGSIEVLALAYPVPPARDPRNVALAALADVLAGEPHGRLYQALVVPGTAQSVFALQQAFARGGHYVLGAQLVPGQSLEAVQALLIEQVETMARQRISAEELQRAKANNRHIEARVLADPAALAEVLSESVALGDWQLVLKRFDQYAALDLQTVQREAEAHFVAQRRLVGQLRPGNEGAAVPVARPVERASAAPEPAALKPAIAHEQPDLAGFNREIMAVERSIQRIHLSNGLKVALRPLPGSSKLVQGSMTLRFGDIESLHGKRAVSQITGTLLLRGTQDASYQQIVDRANRLGVGLAIIPEGGGLNVRFESPKESLPALLTLVSEVLRRPTFVESEFILVKRQRLQALRVPLEQPAAVAGLALRRHVERFPKGDIRRRVEFEELLEETQAVTHEDVQRFYQQFYGADNGELAISGDFDPEQVRTQLDQLLGDWKSPMAHKRTPRPYEAIAPVRLIAKAKAPQTGYYIGRLHFPANARSEDTAALLVAEHILGRHPVASRLGKRLREHESLMYDIRSSIKVATFDDASWLNIQGAYPLGQGQRVADIVKEEVSRLVEAGITQEELDSAQRTIFNERRLMFSQDQNILSWLPRQLYEGVTMASWVERNNAFAAVTVDQINAVMRRNLDAKEMVEILSDNSSSI